MSFNVQLLYLQRLHWPTIVKKVSYAIHFNGLIWPLLLMVFLSIPVKSWGQTGKTFIVNTPGDEADPNAGDFGDDGICDVDLNTPGEQCTCRAAIQNHNANRHLDLNTISFNIDVVGLGLDRVIIKVGSTGLGPLPPILGAVKIQALNQGSPEEAVARVELDGSMAGNNAIGLQLLGGTCHISFFVINNFSSHGIFIAGTPPPGEGGHILESNYIGTDVTGTMDKGNGGDGIFIEDTPDNKIGGPGLLRNIISGNEGYGIHILGRDPNDSGSNSSGAPNNIIEGNFIGLDFFEENILPNTKGGILIEDGRDITVGGTEENKGNKIAGTNNGVTIQGSLAEGIKVEGNFIGKDGAGAKFLVGILHRGKLVTINGNVLVNIDSVGVDAFLDADGIYNIKENRFEGTMKVGTKLTFGEGRIINIEYQNNFHIGNGTGIEVEESLNSTINWVLAGGDVRNGQAGGTFIFKAAGNKNFTHNTWQANASVGLKYTADIEEGVQASVIVNGDIFAENGEDGISGRIEGKGEFSYTLLDINSSRNGQNGLRLDLVASAGARLDMSATGNTLTLNGAAGARLVGDETNIDIFQVFFEKNFVDGNIEGGVNIFNFKLPRSITENTITNNIGPGITLGGISEARIDGNIISGNGTGILIQEEATATVTNNTITANGNAIIMGGTGTGVPFLSNAIFNNIGLGIDLGNDGVTPNDPGDADVGPNNLQNFPVLQSVASSNGNTHIQGSLNSTPNTPFRLDFFSNKVCDPSGFGEGETFLGFGEVTTDGTGNVDFSINLNGITVPEGSFITATATDSANNTSEFAACLPLGTAPLADLELAKEADKALLTIGEQVTFTIKLINQGPDEATNIAVTDVIPAGLLPDQITESTGNYDETIGVWTISSLSSVGEAILTIVATATQEGMVTNIAEVTASDQTDPDSTPNNGEENEDDQSSVTVEVQESVSVEQQLLQLVAQVEDLVDEGELSKQQGKVLTVLLEVTIKLNNKDNTQATISSLRVFNLLVKLLVRRGQLSKVSGETLIQTAEDIIQQLKTEALFARNHLEKGKNMLKGDIEKFVNIRLHPVYPNPFTTSTTITFELAEESIVDLKIYDERGMKTVYEFRGLMSGGAHTLSWEPEHLPAGMYILRLQAGSSVATNRMLLVK